MAATPGKLLWEPSAQDIEGAALTRYMSWLEETRGLRLASYDELWNWSVTQLEDFWASIWDFFEVQAADSLRAGPGRARDARRPVVPRRAALLRRARVRAARSTARESAIAPRLGAARAGHPRPGTSWPTPWLASPPGCGHLGVEPGDRVAAYMPNIAEAVAAFLACAVDRRHLVQLLAGLRGAQSVVDRFSQIEPKVLLAVDGYRYNGKDFDRRDTVAGCSARCRAASAACCCPTCALLEGSGWRVGDLGGADRRRARRAGVRAAGLRPPAVGALQLGHHRAAQGDRARAGRHPAGAPQEDDSCTWTRSPGDRVFWFTTTGWMMWNFLAGVLLTGADDRAVRRQSRPPRPGGAVGPGRGDGDHLLRHLAPRYLGSCMKAGVEPRQRSRPVPLRSRGLHRLAAVAGGLRVGLRARRRRHCGCSPPRAAPTCARRSWAACPLLPVHLGELQCRALGCAVEAWDEEGRSLIGRGRRAGDHRADALDAALLLERPGRRALRARATSRCTRACGATGTGSRSASAAPR